MPQRKSCSVTDEDMQDREVGCQWPFKMPIKLGQLVIRSHRVCVLSDHDLMTAYVTSLSRWCC